MEVFFSSPSQYLVTSFTEMGIFFVFSSSYAPVPAPGAFSPICLFYDDYQTIKSRALVSGFRQILDLGNLCFGDDKECREKFSIIFKGFKDFLLYKEMNLCL
jgi:hypothetical protein